MEFFLKIEALKAKMLSWNKPMDIQTDRRKRKNTYRQTNQQINQQQQTNKQTNKQINNKQINKQTIKSTTTNKYKNIYKHKSDVVLIALWSLSRLSNTSVNSSQLPFP